MSGVKRQIRHQTSATGDLLRLVLHVVVESVDTTGDLSYAHRCAAQYSARYQPN